MMCNIKANTVGLCNNDNKKGLSTNQPEHPLKLHILLRKSCKLS